MPKNNSEESASEQPKAYKLTLAEQEIVITNDAEAHEWDIYSSWPKWVARIEGMLAKYPEEIKLVRRDKYGLQVIVPEKYFAKTLFREPSKRVLSEEEKQAKAAQLAKARKSRNSEA